MTIQIPDTIIYESQEFLTRSFPLTIYLQQTMNLPELIALDSSLWRGYIAKWQITEQKLFLSDITAYIESPDSEDGYTQAGLTELFPHLNQQEKIFASWYSGDIEAYEIEDTGQSLCWIFTIAQGILTESKKLK